MSVMSLAFSVYDHKLSEGCDQHQAVQFTRSPDSRCHEMQALANLAGPGVSSYRRNSGGRVTAGEDPKQKQHKYGCDKPDLRFSLELTDVTDIVVKSDFGVFKDVQSNGGIIKCIVPEKELGRKDIDNYIKFCQESGAKGMAWMRVTANGLESNIAKY